jgi:hypothetical protein
MQGVSTDTALSFDGRIANDGKLLHLVTAPSILAVYP